MACHYHPEAKNTAVCATCRMAICDRCRLNGNSQRCMTCQSEYSKGGSDATRTKRTMCTNHAQTPTDTLCKQCRKPHCVACLNGAQKCFRCAMAAPRTPTGQLKSRGTGKLEKPKPRLQLTKHQLIGAGVVVLLGLGAVGFAKMPHKGAAADSPEEPFMGKAGLKIVAPRAGKAISGPTEIALDIASKGEIQKVVLTIDGKHWEKWERDPKDPEEWLRDKKPPFKTDWPTGIFKNGKHEVLATVTYRGGRRMAQDRKVYTTKNKTY